MPPARGRIRCPSTGHFQLLSSLGGPEAARAAPAFPTVGQKWFERRTKAQYGWRRCSGVAVMQRDGGGSYASSTGISIIHLTHLIGGLGANCKIPDRRSDDRGYSSGNPARRIDID